MGSVCFLVGLLVGGICGMFLMSVLSINSRKEAFKEGVESALDTYDADTDEDNLDETSFDDNTY